MFRYLLYLILHLYLNSYHLHSHLHKLNSYNNYSIININHLGSFCNNLINLTFCLEK